jgi:ribonuclease VapC
MLFVDASAMIAMMTGEAEADRLADRLEAERERVCSAISVWETVAGLCRSYTYSVAGAREAVRGFMALNELKFVAIAEPEFEAAAQAYAEFGKGRHAAALNMGDCFAYACAKTNRAALLFTGGDFSRTDVEIAI